MNWRATASGELTKIYASLRKKREMDLEHLIHLYGKAEEALLYAALFSPIFNEFGSLIIVDSGRVKNEVEEKIDNCRFLGWTDREIEQSFNLIEVGYLFSNRDSSDLLDRALALAMIECWSNALRNRFPQKNFRFEIFDGQESGGAISFVFFQV